MYRLSIVVTFLGLATNWLAASDYYDRFYPSDKILVVETKASVSVKEHFIQKACERIPMEFPGVDGRAEGCGMGLVGDSEIFAFVTASVGTPGEETTPTRRLFHSTDAGRSWESDGIRLPSGVASAFTVLRDGSLLVAAGISATEESPASAAIYHSSDKGHSWQEISRISAAPHAHVFAESLTQLGDGTILMPAGRRGALVDGTPHMVLIADYYYQIVFRSTDGGKSWLEGDRTHHGVYETHLAGLAPDTVLGAFRFSGPYRDWHALKAAAWGAAKKPDNTGRIFKTVFLSDSTDGGITWGRLRPVTNSAGKPLLIFGEAHGRLVQLDRQTVVLASDHRYPYEEYESVAWISYDGGQTWSDNKYHLSDGAGYPDSVALEDGTIVTVTGSTRFDERANPIEPWGLQAIRWKP